MSKPEPPDPLSGLVSIIRQLSAGLAPVVTAIEQLSTGLEPHVRALGEALQKAAVAWNQTLDELEEYAAALEADPLHHDAGVFLRKAVRDFREAEDDYDYADVIHKAVGAVEEVARTRAGKGSRTLAGALKKLKESGSISEDEREFIEWAYIIRNGRRGIGHGAGPAFDLGAALVLLRVRESLRILVPSVVLPSQDQHPSS